MSISNSMLNEHEKSFITSGPGCTASDEDLPLEQALLWLKFPPTMTNALFFVVFFSKNSSKL